VTRIGIIGCGAVTELLHLPSLLANKACRVTALIDRDPRRIAAVSRIVPDAKCSDSYSSVMNDFDAAIVALPHNLHASVAVELLRAGKNVLVEKPMALSVAECDTMIAAAPAPWSLTVGQMRRFSPSVVLAAQLLRSGVLGEIRRVDVRDGSVFAWPVESDFQFRKNKSGGGVLVDTGAHALDMVIGWFGMPKAVAYHDDASGGVECDCVADLHLPSGSACRVELSRTRNLGNSAIIEGSRGKLEVGFNSNVVKCSIPDGSVDTPFVCSLEVPHPDVWRQMFDFQLEDWLGAIKTEKPAKVSGTEARKVVQLIESLYAIRQPLDLSWEHFQTTAHS
jgi:predicted dehydrogenase